MQGELYSLDCYGFSYIILLEVYVCMLSSWTASLWILGSLPWTSFPEICQYNSDAVINHKFTIFFSSCSLGCVSVLLSRGSPWLSTTWTEATSGPLYMYLYRYLHEFIVLHISTFIGALYFYWQVRIVWHYVSVVEGHSIFVTYMPSFLLLYWG